jgi:hypothetical protein
MFEDRSHFNSMELRGITSEIHATSRPYGYFPTFIYFDFSKNGFLQSFLKITRKF